MPNTQEVLFEKGTVWIVSTSSWTGRDKLRPEDIGKEPDDILDIIQLGSKNLLPKEIRDKLKRPRGQLTSLFEKIGKRFLNIKSAFWVANKNTLLAKEGVENIIANQETILDDLIENMPEIKADMIAEYPILADANWPTNEQIRRRFSIKYMVCEIKGASINEADPEDLIEAKRKFQEDLGIAYDEYKEQILNEAKLAIIEACEAITEKILVTGEKVTEATLNKPKRVVEDYMNIAEVFDLDQVKSQVRALQTVLDQTEAKAIRGDWEVAESFATALQRAGENIGDLSGFSSDGTAKRVVRRREAA